MQKFHVGLAPYIDARGIKRADYQALNLQGEAIGTVSLADGEVVSSRGTFDCCMGSLIQKAKQHFNATDPCRFGKLNADATLR